MLRIKLALFVSCAIGALITPSFADSFTEGAPIQAALADAASETGIPMCILQGIAEVESHSIHHVDTSSQIASLDTPRSYGVMGLRDDDFFGHSLSAAAGFIQKDTNSLITDYRSNIRGASYYLKTLAQSHQLSRSAKNRTNCANLAQWKETLEAYSGIPAADSAAYSEQVLQAAIQFSPHWENVALERETPHFDFVPAAHYGGHINPRYIVIHTTEGPYASTVAYFKNTSKEVSAHYVIRSSDGAVTQMVEDTTEAYHARCWNHQAIGIEHEAWSTSGKGLTSALYRSSAALVQHLAEKFNIPIDSSHIIGHDFWETRQYEQSPLYEYDSCNDHNDPGKFWNWNQYFKMMLGQSA